MRARTKNLIPIDYSSLIGGITVIKKKKKVLKNGTLLSFLILSQMREEATDVAEEIDNSVTIKLPLLPCWDESDDGVPGVGLVWVVSTLCSPFPTYSLYCSAL